MGEERMKKIEAIIKPFKLDDVKTALAAEIKAMGASETQAAKVADVLGKNRIAINIVWTLVCGFLVMFMQAGFAMAETGFTRAKNAGHTMAMNFMVYVLGMFGYWLCGFALQMGGAGPFATLGGGGVLDSEFTISLFGKEFGLFGTKGFLLSGDSYDVAVFTIFLFQMVFMDTTASIPTGSMAERWSFKSFLIYGIVVGAVIYPLYANWVWGGGWLSKLGSNFGLGHGHVDFAGSAGAFSSMIYTWLRFGKPDISMSANGLLAGLVAITAPCAFVTAPAAVLIGLIAGILLCWAVIFVERVLKIDDPVGAVSVHGFNGAWGVLSLGLFADGAYGDGFNGVKGAVTGLFYGDAGQLATQSIGILTNIIYVGVIGYVVFKLLDVTMGLRVDPEQEFEGLDQYEVAVIAYPDFHIRSSPR
jgi:ammonia channel protein AmtB